MSWLSSWLKPGKAYGQAQDDLAGGYASSTAYSRPYLDRGVMGGDRAATAMDRLLNPGALRDEWSRGYETSGYAQDMMRDATEQGMDLANAMGLGGSNTALGALSHERSRIMNAERSRYLDDLMNKYMQGAGIARGFYDTGAGVASREADRAYQHASDQAGLTYGKNAAGGNRMNQLLSLGSRFLPFGK